MIIDNSNLVNVIVNYLKETQTPFTLNILMEQIKQSTCYPGMFCISRILDNYNLTSKVYSLREQRINDIPLPFFTCYKKQSGKNYVLVTAITSDCITYITGRKETVSRDDFLKNWENIVLVANHADSIDESQPCAGKQPDLLSQLNALIDFRSWQILLQNAFGEQEAATVDYSILLKIIMLQQYYNISDDDIEYMIADRCSFMGFLELNAANQLPGVPAIQQFRKKLAQSNYQYTFFSKLEELLRANNTSIFRGHMREPFLYMHPNQRPLPALDQVEEITAPHFEKSWLKERVSEIFIQELPYPVKYRSGTTDALIIEQVFEDNVYDLLTNFTPGFIIDCGANIGITSLYFKYKYPDAFIVAIEPETNNYHLLEENLSYYYPDIDCMQAGIWNKKTRLSINDEKNRGNWAFITEEQSGDKAGGIPSITISEIMKKYNRQEIDILKIDIEGSELELFESNYEDWLPKTKLLIIEIHDWIKQGCSKTFYKALINYDFSVSQQAENLICRRI